MDYKIKEETSWEFEEAIRQLIRIGIKSKLLDKNCLVDFIWDIEVDK
ncbi:MAG: hypothetical protein AABY22_14420 [Nanoarchaeota archaeon]